jgi:predicted ATPase
MATQLQTGGTTSTHERRLDDSVGVTHERRLRVFVSSTLKDLAPERAAARRAIENLRLAPVMFELGARPYPPATLYQAYLDQSHIFIGIYWERYGWVAPGMEFSGLEDEYLSSGDKPKLIYVKHPAPEREERLANLIRRMGAEGVSYKRFSDVAELERLIADDLALLLTERFEQARRQQALAIVQGASSNVPALVNRFVGREEEMAALEALLMTREARLVTVTGPGGIGKSRFALELANKLSKRFEDGAHLVLLQAVRDPNLVASTILHSLHVEESGASPVDAVVAHLSTREMLLVLDNFEQVVTAGDVTVRLLTECPRLSIVVTSREVLNLRGEHEFPLPPLEAPPAEIDEVEALRRFEAVRLFLDRARAAKPDFEIEQNNAADIAEIARRLDGLPLALELAAARSRVLTPKAMLARLEDRFKLLSSGWRDLPERHHTLRSTIDWSFDLLSEDDRRLFTRLAIFTGGCTLEAAEAVCGPSGDLDVLEGLASLVDKSLVRLVSDGAEPRYSMFDTIREYALDRLRAAGELDDSRGRHVAYYFDVIASAGEGMRGPTQDEWLARLDAELGNVRSTMAHMLRSGEPSGAVSIGWALWHYWWLHEHLDEGRRWMSEALTHELSDLDRARALAVEGIMAFWQSDYGVCVPAMAEALRVFETAGDNSGVALCELPLGFVESVLGDPQDALGRFDRSREMFDRLGDRWGSAIARIAVCWLWVGSEITISPQAFSEAVDRAEIVGTRAELGMALGNLASRELRAGNLATARSNVVDSLNLLYGTAVRGPSSYGIDVVAEIGLREGDLELAARLFGAADGIRAAIGSPLASMLAERRGRLLKEVSEGLGSRRYEALYSEGQTLSYRDAVTEAIAWCTSERSLHPLS